MNPKKELYIREIVRLINENINAVRRELTNLEDIGLLKSSRKGNLKQYTVNTSMPLYRELTTIILKTEGVSKILQEHLNDLGQIQTAFIYGSFARHTAQAKSDIDVFIIGTIDEKKLISALHDLEHQLSREINYILFSPSEFNKRKKTKDAFVMNVLKEPKIILLGELP